MENILADTAGEGEGGTNWESTIETYTLPHIKQIIDGKLLIKAGSSTQYSATTQRDGMGWVGGRPQGEGTYVYLWLTHVTLWQKQTQHCKAIILQLKIIKKKKILLEMCRRWCWQENINDHVENSTRDFPGGPVVENLPSNAGDTGSIPFWGTNIPHAMGNLSPSSRVSESQLESPCAAAKDPAAARKKLCAATKTRCSQINKH